MYTNNYKFWNQICSEQESKSKTEKLTSAYSKYQISVYTKIFDVLDEIFQNWTFSVKKSKTEQQP